MRQCEYGDTETRENNLVGKDFFKEIRDYKLSEIAETKKSASIDEVEEKALSAAPTLGFESSLRDKHKSGETALIAELKKASPSKGIIREDFDPVSIAKDYEKGGATCLSVLTESKYFKGSAENLVIAREASNLPILRKDFIYDPYQVVEARALGADAILLILSALNNDDDVELLTETAKKYGMDILYEIRTEEEFERILPLKPTLVGINNRYLKSFEVNLEKTHEILNHAHSKKEANKIFWVSESGIKTADEIEQFKNAGAGAFLIGHALVSKEDIFSATRDMLTLPQSAKKTQQIRESSSKEIHVGAK